jgi:heme/copper-type cytochrome/quinol oxidase subunit 2
MRNVLTQLLLAMIFCLLGSMSTAVAEEQESYTLTIKNHMFEPNELEIPANKKIKLVVDNQDPSSEEFESRPLNLEKVVAGGRKVALSVGPLEPGVYEFVGEFHESTAKGRLIAK